MSVGTFDTFFQRTSLSPLWVRAFESVGLADLAHGSALADFNPQFERNHERRHLLPISALLNDLDKPDSSPQSSPLHAPQSTDITDAVRSPEHNDATQITISPSPTPQDVASSPRRWHSCFAQTRHYTMNPFHKHSLAHGHSTWMTKSNSKKSVEISYIHFDLRMSKPIVCILT
jgi:hypothetical protein